MMLILYPNTAQWSDRKVPCIFLLGKLPGNPHVPQKPTDRKLGSIVVLEIEHPPFSSNTETLSNKFPRRGSHHELKVSWEHDSVSRSTLKHESCIT
jgi:hypothetical protein